MPCAGVTYTRPADNQFVWVAPERQDLLADGFILGTTEPDGGVNVGVGVFGRPTPAETIAEGPDVTLGPDAEYQIAEGATVSDVIIPGRVRLGVGARLYNCIVTGPPTEVTFNLALVTGPASGPGASVDFCTIDPDTASPYYDGIADGLTVRRTWIKNVTDGVRAFNQVSGTCRVRMEGCLIESLAQFTPDYAFPGGRPETHNDCAQMQGNPSGDLNDLYFDGCKFNGRHSTTKGDVAELHRAEIAALMLSPNVGDVHVTFTRGWLLGGIFCANAGNDALTGSELTLTDTRFERPGTDTLAPDVAFAVDDTLLPGLTQSGNVFIDNGEPVPVTSA